MMTMRKRCISLLCVGFLMAGILLFSSSCGQSAEQKTGDARVDYEGKTLTASLEENPSTGYAWSFTVDGTSVEAAGDEIVREEENKDDAGAPGTHVFRFEGIAAGTSSIVLDYRRAWEETEEDEGLVITVETEEDGNIKSVSAESSNKG